MSVPPEVGTLYITYHTGHHDSRLSATVCVIGPPTHPPVRMTTGENLRMFNTQRKRLHEARSTKPSRQLAGPPLPDRAGMLVHRSSRQTLVETQARRDRHTNHHRLKKKTGSRRRQHTRKISAGIYFSRNRTPPPCPLPTCFLWPQLYTVSRAGPGFEVVYPPSKLHAQPLRHKWAGDGAHGAISVGMKKNAE